MFCIGGRQQLTQAQYDALLTAEFQGSIRQQSSSLDKAGLFEMVAA
jgi:hypothetical protein